MSGFFKKLFNRIVGKTEEPVPDVPALPAPEPVLEVAPEPVAKKTKAKATPKKTEPKKPEPKKPAAKAKVEAAKPGVAKVGTSAAKKVASKKVVAPTKPAKKTGAKKPEVKQPEPKKAVSKSAALPKPAPHKATTKKSAGTKPATLPREIQQGETPPVVPPAVVEKPSIEPAPPPAVIETAPPAVDVQQRKGWFSKLAEGLSKSSKSITGSITAIFTKRKLDKETLQELEDTLIQADLGLSVSERIIAAVSHGRYDKEIDPDEVRNILAAEVAKVLQPVEVPFNFGSEKPFVVLVVGVNGSGKTTTIGKLGAIAAREDFKVKFAACDTFRAAAIEQLTVWGNRIGAETISRPQGADAAGLAFDAMKAANDDGTDILFIDTAGRLHNKAYLMDELDKVVRVIKKYDAGAPHAVLLVLDATTGQNAIAQAEAFTKVAGVTGLIMTKLDGTARGGILVAIAEKFKLPIHAIGVGESIDDLQAFDAVAFARAIAGLEDK